MTVSSRKLRIPSPLCSPYWLLVSTTFQDSPCIPASFVTLWHSVQVMISPAAFKTITLRGKWGTQSFTYSSVNINWVPYYSWVSICEKEIDKNFCPHKAYIYDAGRDRGQEEKGTTEDEMARWHYWPDGRESEWTPGAGDGQGGLACCNSWDHKESNTTEQLNWTELKAYILVRGTKKKHCKWILCWR